MDLTMLLLRSMCGIPFKILDKKMEKKLMLRRKKDLQYQLQEASKERDIIELSIMLIYQNVKGLVVMGGEMSTSVLNQLLAEKKVPTGIAERLRPIFDQYQTTQNTMQSDDLEFMRNCGLCKDLKHLL